MMLGRVFFKGAIVEETLLCRARHDVAGREASVLSTFMGTVNVAHPCRYMSRVWKSTRDNICDHFLFFFHTDLMEYLFVGTRCIVSVTQ